MDLGIAGRRAVVCGSSRGLGLACAEALAAEGVDVVLNGRGQEALDDAVRRIAARYDVEVRGVPGDVALQATRDELVRVGGEVDILVTNAGGPTPAAFTDLDHARWLAAVDTNMLAPLLLIRDVVDGMVERRFGRIVNITSAMVTSPHQSMALSSGARAGLTAAVKSLSRAVARHNVTVNNVLPERIDTDRQVFMANRAVERDGITYEEARTKQVASIAARRLGRPEELGAACAFLCSAHAGYISGNNLHIDGGSYAGLV